MASNKKEPFRDQIFNNAATKWTQVGANDGDIVLSSRLRLARNMKGMPFPFRLPAQKEKILADVVAGAIEQLEKKTRHEYCFLRLAELTVLERQQLLEKHLISKELAASEDYPAVAIRKDEAIAIMVNEEDHIRIQCFLPGLQLDQVWQLANEVDDILCGQLNFAFDNEFGYLTACPTNVGTGMRASVMLHLPALVTIKKLDAIFATLPKLGLTVRGLYGEGTKGAGNLFQISNQVTLGNGELEIIHHLQSVVSQVVEKERQARRILQKEYAITLYDKIWRACGTLAFARSISTDELIERLSQLRLGVDMGIIGGITGEEINALLIATQPAFIQSRAEKELSPSIRDWERATLVRKVLANVMEVNAHD